MTRAFSRPRRFGIAALSVTLAALLFRTQASQALVVRGDDYVYQGRPQAALSHYSRALLFDPASPVAVDRYIFVSMQGHTALGLREGISVADRFLARNPKNATVLADRGMCYLVQRRYQAARRDFEAAAFIEPRSYQYAVAARILERLSKGKK